MCLKKLVPLYHDDIGKLREDGCKVCVSPQVMNCMQAEQHQALAEYFVNLVQYIAGFVAKGRMVTALCASYGFKSSSIKEGSLLVSFFMFCSKKKQPVNLEALQNPCAKCGGLHATS